MCEFSLRVLVEKKGKPLTTRVRFFLHFRDPVFALVGQYRDGHSGQTHFFGVGAPTCAPRLH
jgi:ketosteroid isomerase-like protein